MPSKSKLTPKKNTNIKRKKKTVEETYVKMDQHQHVLERSDMYIGSIEEDTQQMWILNEEKQLMEFKKITYVPGLYKIFDEIIVNARDHTVRDNTCKTIKVTINKEDGSISCFNDGDEYNIPIEIHKEHKVYVPEMIFGMLLTSGNYGNEERILGGKNGLGSKACNIFSKMFHIEVVDSNKMLRYKQTFSNNMYTKEKPVITKLNKRTGSSLCIRFIPDYERFGLTGLTDDTIALFKKRVYDVAAGTNKDIKVYLNDELIKIDTFKDYVGMFYEDKNYLTDRLIYEYAGVGPNTKTLSDKESEQQKRIYGDRWKVVAVFDPLPGTHRQISYVNGISTPDGGSHVDHVVSQIVSEISKHIKAKHKKLRFTSSQIKDNITLFLDSVIVNPSFESQTKTKLKHKISNFGSRCHLSPDFFKKFMKTGIIDEVVSFAKLKEEAAYGRNTDGKKRKKLKGLEKLDDADWAGGRKSLECRLILTEGDSAKNFAIAGKEVIGHERYGVFPLKGKLLNVREATMAQLKNNEEIINIKQIMGLKQSLTYESEEELRQLRYGGIVLLTDQDVDGSHIKGLLINFLHYFWPNLLKTEGFVQSMATPIIKVWKKSDDNKKNKKVITFYTLSEYEAWKSNIGSSLNLWRSKYYKGLGTSDDDEARESFTDFEKRLINYVWEQNDEEHIHLAFAKKLADERKSWLMNYDKNVIIENNEHHVSYTDFVNKELVHFSNYDNIRSIPSIRDGLKPSQRKILYGSILRNLFKTEVKVAQLSGFVSDKAAYHHGEVSLQGTIIGMAQDFPGSNNINILDPRGQFGNRRQGGKNHASARYIFTKICELTPLIFRSEDNCILDYVDDDGQKVEPVTYAPIIPLCLINGVKGIGTGFSTTIPSFNPEDIINNIRRRIKGEPLKFLYPWFKNFKENERIIKLNNSTFRISGKLTIENENTVVITELPVGTWTEDYFKFLDSIIADDPKNPGKGMLLKDRADKCGNNTIHITLTFLDGMIRRLEKDGILEKKLKLYNLCSLSNMHLHDQNGIIKKYDTVNDVIEDYYQYRLKAYELRKEHYLRYLEHKLDLIKWKIKFLEHVIDGRIKMTQNEKPISKSVVINQLEEFRFPKLSNNMDAIDDNKTYNYATDSRICELTIEELEKLRKQHDERNAEYIDYKNTPIEEIWLRELNELEIAYKKWYELTSYDGNDGKIKKTKGKRKTKTKNRNIRNKKKVKSYPKTRGANL